MYNVAVREMRITLVVQLVTGVPSLSGQENRAMTIDSQSH